MLKVMVAEAPTRCAACIPYTAYIYRPNIAKRFGVVCCPLHLIISKACTSFQSDNSICCTTPLPEVGRKWS